MADRESQNIEFKSAWKDDCLKAISAFANGTGGKVLIGLNDRGQFVGLKNAVKLLEDIPNIIRNKLGIIPTVELSRTNNDEFISIIINPSSVPISCNGRFYLRSGSTVQELRGKELADFLMIKTGSTWDDVMEERGDRASIDNVTVEDFKRFAVDRIPAITRETDSDTILKKLNLITNERVKRAAALLFFADPQQFYSHAVVKIGRFLTDTEIQTTDVVKGNLFRQLENTLEILRSKYLQSNIKFEDIHRRDILEYPHEALREAIINALIHRDYREFSQIQIRVYSDKLIIMNEGRLPLEVPVEKLKTNHLSKPRNKLLAETFYYAGFIEAWGRGTIEIVEKCAKQGLPEPDFTEENGVMSVTFYKDKWNPGNLQKVGLNERQMKAVMYIKENGKITNKDYKELIKNISRITATRDLSNLVEKGILKMVGTGKRQVHYILNESKKMQ
ncbi:MAG: ATP-binding protein [Thermodesulfobacteriota bacterium]